MSAQRSNVTLAEAAAILRREPRVTVTTHAKPDGDAFGSAIALTAALRRLGHDARGLLMPPVPASFRRLRGAELADEHRPQFGFSPDSFTVVLDTGAWAQVAPIRAELEARLGRTLIVDHHLSGDIPARWRHVDAGAAACCELVAELIDELAAAPGDAAGDGAAGAAVDALYTAEVREGLFVGIAADTGWFRFSNTTARTHALAARLLRLGVDHDALYQSLEQAERPEKLRLMGRALDSLRFLADGRAALMVLRAADFAETGALPEETDGLVDLPRMVARVQVVALVTEGPASAAGAAAPPVRVSFRSKPGEGAIDVNALARQLGGGGHARAAGAKIEAPIDVALARVEAALIAAAAPQEALAIDERR